MVGNYPSNRLMIRTASLKRPRFSEEDSVFLFLHASYRRYSRQGQSLVDFPSVGERLRLETVMNRSLPRTSVDEHVAYGHHAAGPADVFSDQ